MQRLYKFLFLLFIVLFIISTLLETTALWASITILKNSGSKGLMIFKEVPFRHYFLGGLVYGFCLALALELSIVLLLHLSHKRGKKFSTRRMLTYIGIFFLITLSINLAYLIHFNNLGQFGFLLLYYTADSFFLPFSWLPFAIAWIILHFIFAEIIKKS